MARAASTTRAGKGASARRGAQAFERVVLITGAEGLLTERAVEAQLAELRAIDAEAEVTEVEAVRLDGQRLAEMTGPSLFSSRRVAVVADLANLPAELADPLVALAQDRAPDLALLLVHGGGQKGKGVLDRLRKTGAQVVDCVAPKTWDLPGFAVNEARLAGGSLPVSVAPLLIDAVGHDLRALAAAVAQLVDDAEDGQVTAEQIRRYFAGRAEVSSFAVADAVLLGKTGQAFEQLRWTMATGVAPVLVTSAMASGLRGLGKLITAPGGLRENDLAAAVGVPPWKLKSMRVQARGWEQGGVARALLAVATADAEVKGAAEDPDFALEKMLIAVSRARRG